MRTGVFIIAEAGVNHNGDLNLAHQLIDAAADAGADAVKFQTFRASQLASANVGTADYQQHQTGAESQRAMLAKLELPFDWHAELQAHAAERSIEFLSTAFDPESLAFLGSLNLPRLKIPSGEISNARLLWEYAQTGKPLILSTGMSSLGDIEQALAMLAYSLCHPKPPCDLIQVQQFYTSAEAHTALEKHLTLLHCTSEYPAPPQTINLRAMDTLAQAFNLPVGYSDHSAGISIPVAAVARGACLIEKHFTLDRSLPGPDHAASLEPAELANMVEQIRTVEQALGSPRKYPQTPEWATRGKVRQVLVTTTEIRAGAIFTPQNLTTQRAGQGLSALHYWDLLGTQAAQDLQAGEVIPDA